MVIRLFECYKMFQVIDALKHLRHCFVQIKLIARGSKCHGRSMFKKKNTLQKFVCFLSAYSFSQKLFTPAVHCNRSHRYKRLSVQPRQPRRAPFYGSTDRCGAESAPGCKRLSKSPLLLPVIFCCSFLNLLLYHANAPFKPH